MIINSFNRSKKQNEIARMQWRISSWAISLALAVAVVFLLFQEKTIAKGLLLGTFFSIINFYVLGLFIPMTMGRSRSKAGAIGLASILTRFILLAIPLILAIKSVSFNFVAVVIGIFAVQIVTLFHFIIIRPILDGR